MYWSIGCEELRRWWYAFSTSPGVARTSPGLVLPTQGLVRTSRRVVRRTSRFLRPDKRGGSVTLNMPPSVLKMPVSRAYIRIYFPEKAFTSFTQSVFPSDFQGFLCERLVCKAFTRAVNARDGRRKQTFTQGNYLKIRKSQIETWTRGVNIWEGNASYTFPLEIRRKHSVYEWLNDFFEGKNAYRGVWTGGL